MDIVSTKELMWRERAANRVADDCAQMWIELQIDGDPHGVADDCVDDKDTFIRDVFALTARNSGNCSGLGCSILDYVGVCIEARALRNEAARVYDEVTDE